MAAVKATLSTPLGAVAAPELEQLGHELKDKGQAVVATARPVLDQAAAHLETTVHLAPQPPASPDAASRTSPSAAAGNGTVGASDAHSRLTRRYGPALFRKILRQAALRHGVDPKLVLALSYWESGWDQTKVSETGAVGLMQVEPATAQEAGPALLGRSVDIDDPYDNADVGVAVLKEDLATFSKPAMALAAYYQGPTSLRENGMLPDTQQYVEGILDLAKRLD